MAKKVGQGRATSPAAERWTLGGTIMAADERLIFRLHGGAGYVDASACVGSSLPIIPEDTVFLDLGYSAVTDVGINTLGELPDLRCIDLDLTGITDTAMQLIAKFTSLEEIYIEGTAVSDKGLSHLHGLHRLRFISILDCAISDEAVEILRKAIPGVEIAANQSDVKRILKSEGRWG